MDPRKFFVVSVGVCVIVSFLLQKPDDERTAWIEGVSSGSDSSSSSSSSCSFCGSNFEVYLSFKAKDVGPNFADHLFKAVVNGGFRPFRDEEIEIGEEEDAARHSAIRQSKIAILILSKNYACRECLSELVEIMERKIEGHITVMPIFYHVSPSEVRNQNGCFQMAFQNHDINSDPITVQEWRKAMRQIGDLRGWVAADWVERKLIEAIVELIRKKLMKGEIDEGPLDYERNPFSLFWVNARVYAERVLKAYT